MSSDLPSLFIANGTCYFKAGEELSSDFIPCGNDYFAHYQCCSLGDNCLEHGACYDSQFGVTYLAGCSDKNYDDPACPNKGDQAGMKT